MILYEYYCIECEAVREARTDIKDRNKVKCPDCGKKMKRHYTSPHLSSKRCTFGY